MTPHNNAKSGDIADTVLMPGDPLRAQFMADRYLSDVKQFNDVRNMFGYTGIYKDKRVSIMGSGMGMPSIGIYSYELYSFYGVQNIIRVGTAGAYSDKVRVNDIILAEGACTDSAYVNHYNLPGVFAPIASFNLLKSAASIAERMKAKICVGNILSSDVFYNDDSSETERWKKMGVLAVEMESAALYMNAARLGKNALAILTVSDNLSTGETMTSEERQKSCSLMFEIALETANMI
jgi:purine-nucleoside phosphorylase